MKLNFKAIILLIALHTCGIPKSYGEGPLYEWIILNINLPQALAIIENPAVIDVVARHLVINSQLLEIMYASNPVFRDFNRSDIYQIALNIIRTTLVEIFYNEKE